MDQACTRAADVLPIVRQAQAAGATSLHQLATALVARGIPTPSGSGTSALSSARGLVKAGVKQLPLTVSTWDKRNWNTAAASRKGDGALLGFVVLDGQVDGAGAPVDSYKQVALAPLALNCLQLPQVLDVDVHEAEVIILEGALFLGGGVGRGWWPPVQFFGFQDAPNAVAVELGQEVVNQEVRS